MNSVMTIGQDQDQHHEHVFAKYMSTYVDTGACPASKGYKRRKKKTRFIRAHQDRKKRMLLLCRRAAFRGFTSKALTST